MTFFYLKRDTIRFFFFFKVVSTVEVWLLFDLPDSEAHPAEVGVGVTYRKKPHSDAMRERVTDSFRRWILIDWVAPVPNAMECCCARDRFTLISLPALSLRWAMG